MIESVSAIDLAALGRASTVALAVSLSFSVATACTTFGEAAPSEDAGSKDVTGGEGDGGATPRGDASTGDAAAPTARFCDSAKTASGVVGCWDFDGASDLATAFDGVRGVPDSGTVDVVADDGAAPGGNKVLRATLVDAKVGRTVFAYRAVQKPTAGVRYRLTYRFQVRASKIDSVYLGVLFHFYDPGAGQPLGAASYGFGSRIGAVPLAQDTNGSVGPRWRSAVVDVDGADPVSGRVEVDGAVLFSGRIDARAPNFGVYLGAIYANATGGAFEVRYDDVLLVRR